jgi:hypothetical protein
MFDELIAQLDGMGVDYIEDYDIGTLTIELGDVDKIQLIEIIGAINSSMLPFDIDATAITVSGGEEIEDEEEDLMLEEDMMPDLGGTGGVGGMPGT